jgi:hypothetical protein
MTRISDKPLAFQAVQQRRRERAEASQAAEHIRLLKSVGNQSINNQPPWYWDTSAISGALLDTRIKPV